MEESAPGFDEFSVEMGSFEMMKVKKFDRLWKISTGGSIDQEPLIYDDKIYVGSFNHNVYCLDAMTGQFIWKFKARDRIGIASPVVANGVIYIGSYDQNMYALDAKTGALVWKFFTRGEIIDSAVVLNDTAYFGSKDKFFYAVDAKTGAERWKLRTMGEIICDPTVYRDRILIGSYDKNLYCLDAATGAVIWKFRAEQEIANSGQLAIIDNHVFLTSFDNYLRKIDLETGREVWRRRLSQYGLNCGSVIHGDLLLVPSRDGVMYGLDLDGNVKWKFTTTKPVGNPTVYGERVYFTSEDYNLYCLSLEGHVIWKYKTQDMVWWKPAAWNGRMHFGSYDCHFYSVDADTGEVIWKFRTQGQPSTGPPPYETFELSVMAPKEEVEDVKRKSYNAAIEEESDADAHFYKSRITYQTSTQYQSRGGKYQVDSDEEEL